MYFSTGQASIGCCHVLVRTEGDPETLLSGLRSVVAETGSGVTASHVGTFGDHLGAALAVPRATTMLMGGFSLLALVLATLGVYAVVSFAVARRSAELGIRVALGAARSSVIAMVVRESLGTVTFGAAVGLALALLAAPRLEGALFQVGVVDPVAFAGGAALLMAVAGIASWVPAWRAARADPVDVLKAQ
jgi:ABC-type antimicrobial peptide transport system permease subunit